MVRALTLRSASLRFNDMMNAGQIKKRVEAGANYSAVWFNGKTLRVPLDPKKPITELEWPEFYDISLGDKCETGKCAWCYAKGRPTGRHYPDVANRIDDYFGAMSTNQRPFQVAIGGQQEPLEHPEIEKVLEVFHCLGIVPNFTTNGVLFNQNAVRLAKTYCGGIAISTHPHLQKEWEAATDLATSEGIRTNLHIIISDRASIDRLKEIYKKYSGKVEYFVLLPHQNVGFAEKNPKQIDYDYLEAWLDTIAKTGDIAFGANFYKFLKRLQKYDVSLYPPEILSKYLVCDENMGLFNNSFEMKAVKYE